MPWKEQCRTQVLSPGGSRVPTGLFLVLILLHVPPIPPEEPTPISMDAVHCDLFGSVPPSPVRQERNGSSGAEPSPSHPLKLDTRGVKSQATQTWFKLKNLPIRDSMVRSLDGAGRSDLSDPIRGCHSQQSFKQCVKCKTAKPFWNHCDVRYCPVCQPTLARKRADELKWWVDSIKQPKHVVLTLRNVANIDRGFMRGVKLSLSKLRRRKFASGWKGGLYSLEVTNTGKGWHVHIHLLVDARWIDQLELAKQWAMVLGQDKAIVKVQDARGLDYLKEVAKYVVKGTDLALWQTPHLIELIDALEGVRMFGTFGSLRARRAAFAAWKLEQEEREVACPCGCTSWKILSENEYLWSIHTQPNAPNPPGPTPPRGERSGPEQWFACFASHPTQRDSFGAMAR